jgi:hypothetical protein
MGSSEVRLHHFRSSLFPSNRICEIVEGEDGQRFVRLYGAGGEGVAASTVGAASGVWSIFHRARIRATISSNFLI